jgi:drug/metabolite transporter (DMT)-like permease
MTQLNLAPKWKLIAAFAAIYLIWGSTYLAIVFAIDTMPPLLMVGSRFAVAGLLVLAWCVVRGQDLPRPRQWRNAGIVGTMTLAVGVGSVAWAEQWVPSGVAALLVTSVPLWIVLIEWLWRGGAHPNGFVISGLALGLLGIVLLVQPGQLWIGNGAVLGIVAILAASLTFSFGAILGRELEMPDGAALSTAVQMLIGGGALLVFGALRGEIDTLSFGSISLSSWAAWLYLMTFGSIVAFGSFVWLMNHAAPTQVSTYAYVNPVVAVFLGWILAGEPMGLQVAFAVFLLVSAVILISRFGKRASHGPKRVRRRKSRSTAVLRVLARSLDRPATSLSRPGRKSLESKY